MIFAKRMRRNDFSIKADVSVPLPLAGGVRGGRAIMTTVRYQNSRFDFRRATTLRKQSPLVERLLWDVLTETGRAEKLHFRRQYPVHPYFADFACVKARLLIELDGMSHDAQQAYDAKRDTYLQNKKWRIIRFSNDEVLNNLDGVVLTIVERAKMLLALPRSLPQAGGRR